MDNEVGRHDHDQNTAPVAFWVSGGQMTSFYTQLANYVSFLLGSRVQIVFEILITLRPPRFSRYPTTSAHTGQASRHHEQLGE